ncbi:MAG: polysaccharide deacetylase family protein [Clostridium sp.]|nr:polysaccharide deacetylase [Clostridium sp.]
MKKKFIFLLKLILILNIFTFIPFKNAYCEDEKIIYLTFDDGPGGKITKDTLDILKSENVKATFFLIGEQIKGQEDLVKRILEEGHSIGLHSMDHKKENLYSSDNNFLKEMLDSQKIIEEVTGEKINILRFPFGSNNDTYHLKESLVNLLHENNLKIYDWNVDSTDGANPYGNPCTIVKNATKNKDKQEVILLMHCGYINKNSTIALPEVIKYYKDNGYTFKAINENTSEMFHYIN